MTDELRGMIHEIDDPRVLRAALDATLDYLDELASRRTEDGIHVSTYTRRLIARTLRGQTIYDTTRPPELPIDTDASLRRGVADVAAGRVRRRDDFLVTGSDNE